jgi:hypothetical protein
MRPEEVCRIRKMNVQLESSPRRLHSVRQNKGGSAPCALKRRGNCDSQGSARIREMRISIPASQRREPAKVEGE